MQLLLKVMDFPPKMVEVAKEDFEKFRKRHLFEEPTENILIPIEINNQKYVIYTGENMQGGFGNEHFIIKGSKEKLVYGIVIIAKISETEEILDITETDLKEITDCFTDGIPYGNGQVSFFKVGYPTKGELI
ncbi:hypothetical protein ACTFQL_27645 [Bacillus cereus group sp. MYBK44-1]|uniref:hypothetical protein n=1 Tax=unclassified Bacillus cereus group TaxID=2750818 RepID=UPI003F25CE06